MKDRLSRCYEVGVHVALPVLNALLVDCELYHRHYIWEESLRVFEPDGHVVGCGCSGEEFYVVRCIGFGEIEAVYVVLFGQPT